MSPLILALDTTHEHGSIALARGAQTLEEISLHAPDGFAHVIYRHLSALLDRYGVAAGDIDCFASAAGPGSFTGVRVGLACIKGLAAACGKPAIAISNLAALSTFGTAPLRAPVIDARRGEIYGAVYDAETRPVRPEVVTKLEAFQAQLPAGAEVISTPRPLAAAIARLAFRAFERGEAADPASLDANYVRRFDAELFWKD